MNASVLIVEDSPDNLVIIKKIMHHMGYNVITAEDGNTGVKLTKEYQPDLVVMDYHLPGMNGLDATREIKSCSELNHIPVIALTADIYAKQEFMDAGCDAYLSKPVRRGSLLRAIQQVLGSNR